ncbi:MAG TPA: Gldg family protein [Myxococcota bacterium]|nr:Gldg family protein [Myxococcota bacterium]
MKHTMAIARKEWRASFLSPVALIFLAIFLLASLFVFFFVEGFFARNIADARPFFDGMPVLLVLLASAFTMRLWSEEARSGTLEVLLTLPLRIREVVLGKFLAGVGLMLVALLLTLPVPITVSILGNLDWGPVIGGYLGLLLLACAYLAIGMFISSLTNNQLVALLMSIVVCGLLVLLGYLPRLVPMGLAVDEILRGLGTGSRFDSMLRGVLDLRDLIYYLSLAALFLALNGLSLERRRWSSGPQGRSRHRGLVLGVVLLGANLLVFNLGMAPIAGLRADMTEWGEFSISPVTKQLLNGAKEPLLVRGYFSDKTHPLLDPLVPRIKDFLRELRVAGGSNVSCEFIDPTNDDEAIKEAQSKYGIRSVPFRFSNRNEDSVVNAYFDILVRYGDRFEVLNFADLIDVEVQGTDVRVSLRNLEYDIARSIKKVIYGFKSLESVCMQIEGEASLKIFASSKNMPTELAEIPKRIEKAADEIKKRCGGKFDYSLIDPDQAESGITPEQLYKQYGIKPMALSILDNRTFYLSMLMQIGDKAEALNISGKLSEADAKREIQASLQRHAPGFMKTVGIFVSKTAPKMNYPGMPPPRNQTFNALKKQLSGTYEVTDVDLSSGIVPGYVDVLVVLGPRDLGERERFAIDQFLMRGGSAIITAGAYTFEPGQSGTLDVNLKKTGLSEMLKTYGVEVGQAVVLDEQNAAFPVPVVRQLGNMRVREIKLVHYPPFVDVSGDGLAGDNPATAALPSVVFHWSSPVSCQAADKQASGNKPVCKTLLQSSDKAWEVPYFQAQPDFQRFPGLGFSEPERTKRIPLAVSVVGKLESFFKGKQSPVLSGEKPGPAAKGKPEKKEGHRAGMIERSEQEARLLVLGSANFVNDIVLSISSQVSQANLANLQFVNNLVDWSVEDAGLLSIRSKERFARTLARLDSGEMIGWQVGNFAFAILAVVLIGLITLGRRGRAVPIMAAGAGKDEGRKES